MIGKSGSPVTRISQAYPDRVEVRGRDLTELMGRLSFTEYFHLLLTGHEPTEAQAYFLDVLLVAIGATATMCLEVADGLTAQGIGVTVVDPRWIKPVDPALVGLAATHRLVVTVEDNGVAGGVGSAVSATLRRAEIVPRTRPHTSAS